LPTPVVAPRTVLRQNLLHSEAIEVK
jgi:hypothetical protein